MSFSKYLESKKELLKKLINDLQEKYAYASVLGVDTEGVRISVNKFQMEVKDSPSSERGFVLKLYDEKGYLEYSFDDINEENYQSILSKALSLEVPSTLARVKAKKIEEEQLTKEFSRIDEKPLSEQEVLNVLTEIKDYVLTKDQKIVNVMVSFEKFELSKIFISKNKELKQSYPWCNAGVVIVTMKDGNFKSARKGSGGKDTLLVLESLRGKIDEACDLALALLNSMPIVPGVYDVITDPSITGLIAHEAFGHGVEMDMFVKNRAKSKDYIGKYVASPIVNMHDGAAAAYSVASYFFDDDGVLAQDTQIIKDGILVGGMSDVLSAMELGYKPTGNGRRESSTHKAYTRMTNTFFSKGNDKLEDMIASIDYGFYISDTNNGMEDPKNWQIQCVCEYAKEIKDGKFTGRIFSPVVLSGYVPDLLKSITMISDAFEVDGAGYCGKGHKEWVRVSDGGPHLKARVKIG